MLGPDSERVYESKTDDYIVPNRSIISETKEINNSKEEINISEKKEVNESEPKKEEIEIVDNKKTLNTNRVATGIEGFDDLIEGGFERNSTILIVGSAGTGKTLISLQFLYKGLTDFNEPGVFISFEEEKNSIYKHSLQFGWDFKKYEEENKFRLLFFKPHQVTKILEEGGGQIRDALTEINAKRVVIDSITAYSLLFTDEYKRREKVLEFFNLLSKWGITSIIIAESSADGIEKKEGSIAFISDAVISMYYHHDSEKGIRTHSLEIVKMRGTKHTNKVCAINFEDDGIKIYPDVEVF